jgi:RNA polymerase sigma-70 factor, ECF subfamily
MSVKALDADWRVSVLRSSRAGASEVEALYRDYGDRIYNFSYSLTRNATDAEDLTQDVFVAAHRELDRFEGRCTVATWLFKIAIHRWQNLRRRKRADTVSLDEAELAGAAADPTDAQVEHLQLHRALEALPELHRVAFLLVKAEGLSYEEAAEVLGVPKGTLRSRVHTARQQLAALLESDHPGHGTPPP